MQTRPLGTTGHESSIVTFGTIALAFLAQDEANEMAADVLDAGVNHFDVAPTYGDAELKLAPTLAARRDEIFLGCKTKERTYYGAWGELHRSLDRLGTDHIDLYQFHAVTRYRELETILGEYTPELAQEGDEGALAAFREAQAEGIVDHIGLTSHGDPSLIRTAIRRIPDLATVMFPFNHTLDAKRGPEYDYRSVLELAHEHDLGTLCIKGFAKEPWPDDLPEDDRPYETWYRPYDTPDALDECLRYTLSQGMTSIPSAGDPELVSHILAAAARFEPMADDEQRQLRDAARDSDSPVPRQ